MYHSLVLSILSYVCENWMINSFIYKQNQTIQKQVPHETDRDKESGHKHNDYVRHTIISIIGYSEPLLQKIKRNNNVSMYIIDWNCESSLLKINVQNHLEITYKLKINVQNTFKHVLSNCVRYYYNNKVQSQ